MRKLFSTLKSVVAVAIVASMTLAASCSYDDTAIKNKVDKVESDLAALTERVDALEQRFTEEMPTLEDLLDGKLVITEVTTDADGNTTLKLSDGSTVTVLAEGLQYRVTGGVLEVSADGETWVALGVEPEFVIADAVVNTDNTVTLTLADGTEVTLVKAEVIEFNATRGQLYVLPGETKDLRFTINDAVAEINVMNQPLGWKAEVALAPAEEETPEEGDDLIDDMPMPAPAAAGGTDYVLKITGPAQDFVNAGYAAKEGDIVVHFNSNSGACKVGKIAVNLAELTLEVDKDGNVIVTNSVVWEYSPMYGGDYIDFADFWIGAMPKSLYEEYGDRALIEDFDSMMCNNETACFTRRTALYFLELMEYVEGEYEKETHQFTLEQMGKIMDPQFTFKMGEEYIIFVSLEEEMENYESFPVLKNAIMVDYKAAAVNAEYVADSATWNNAQYTFTLAGYTHFIVGWSMKAEVDSYIESGYVSTVEDFLALKAGDGLFQLGMYVPGPIVDQTLNLSELGAMTEEEYQLPIVPDTEYYFHIYPVNLYSEMDQWTHKVVKEDLKVFGTFKTAPVTEGNFDAGVTYTEDSDDYDNLIVNVDFNDEYTVYYDFYTEPTIETPYDRIAEYFKYGTPVVGNNLKAKAYNYGKYPQFLSMVVINAAGEYIYVEKEFTEPKPEAIVFTSAAAEDAYSQYYGDYKKLTLSNDTMTVVFGLRNGGYSYLPQTTYGNYWDDQNATYSVMDTYTCWTWDNVFTANNAVPTVVVSLNEEGKYKLDITVEYYDGSVPAVEAVFEGDINGIGYETAGGETIETIELTSAVATSAGSSNIGGTGYNLTFSDGNGTEIVYMVQTLGNTYLKEGEWNGNYAWSDEGYISSVTWTNVNTAWPYTMTVAVVDGAYDINLEIVDFYGAGQPTRTAHYAGQIEGFTLPGAGGAEDGGAEDGVIYVNTFVGTEKADSYCDYFHFSDGTGNNEVKFVVDKAGAVADGWIKTGEYPTWQSSVSNILKGTHFSFINQSLIVNGTTYKNSEVSNATASVDADGNVTINFTVGGTAYVFKHNK